MDASATARARLSAALSGALLLLIALLGLSAQSVSAEVTPVQVASLLDEHGPGPLIEVLLDAGNARMSIESGGRLQDVWGRPRKELVSARSLARDVNRAGLDLDTFTSRLDAYAADQARRDRRLTGTDGVVSVNIPLATFDPNLRIRSRRRSWTVKKLIEDADKYRREWSADLNRLRKQEAYKRNRQIELILTSWQSRFGSADMRQVERTLLAEGRDRMYACRKLHRRRNRDEWRDQECDVWNRWNPSQVRRDLQAQIEKPFEIFESALKPTLERLQQNRRIGQLY